MGISRSKEIGIKAARGKYLTFIDGDDWLDHDALRRMAEPAIEHKVDIVVMNNYRILPLFGIKKLNSSVGVPYDQVLHKPEIDKMVLPTFFGEQGLSGVAFWAKLYRRDLVISANFEFPSKGDVAGEDFFFNMDVFPLAQSVYFINYAGYYWRWGGLTSGSHSIEGWKPSKMIELHYRHYAKRVALMQDTGNEYLLPALARETRSTLWHNLVEIATSDSGTPQARDVCKYINELAQHEAAADMRLINKDDEFVAAFVEGNSNRVYEICHAHYCATKNKTKLRKFFAKMISRIS